MNTLNLAPNIDNADDFYAELLAAYEDLSKDQRDAFNARLLLILCNHIGDRDILRAAFAETAKADRNSAD